MAALQHLIPPVYGPTTIFTRDPPHNGLHAEIRADVDPLKGS